MVGTPGTREHATEARGHGHNKRRNLGEVTIITAKTEGVAELPHNNDKSLNFHKLRLSYVHKIL